MSEAAIRAVDVSRIHEIPGRPEAAVRAVDQVSLSLPTGSMTAIVGPSGCGKSSLLHCLAGLDFPSGGTVHLLGHDLGAMARRGRSTFRSRTVGFIFQDHNLVSSLSAAQNVALPLRLRGERHTNALVDDALARVGMEHRRNELPHRLSGGERQRVAIARVMAASTPVVFADEPTAALDADNAAVVLDWLRRLTAGGTTVLMVTHDAAAAERADRVLVMAGGRVVAEREQADAATILGLVTAARGVAR